MLLNFVARAIQLLKQKQVANTGWLISEKIIKVLLMFFVTTYIARQLGPSNFGPISYILSIILILQSIAILGMDALVVRDLSRHPEDSGHILSTVFILRLGAGLSLFFFFLTYTLLRSDISWDSQGFRIVSLLALPIVFQSLDTVDLWFQSNSVSKLSVIARIPSYILGAAVKLFAAYKGLSISFIALGYAIECISIGTLLLIMLNKYPIEEKLIFSGVYAKSLIKESIPVAISSLLAMIYMRVDQILLKTLSGVTEVGKYSAVIPFLETSYTIPNVLCISWAPIMAQIFINDKNAFYRNYMRLHKGLIIIAWLIIGVSFLFAEYFVTTFLGNQYLDCIVLIKVFSISLLFTFIGIAQGIWLVNNNVTKLLLRKTMLGVSMSILSNLVLIPKYGALGCAYSALFSQFVSSFASNLFFVPELFRIQVASLLMLNYKYSDSK